VKSAELQTEINQLARNLGVRPISVGFRTRNGLTFMLATRACTTSLFTSGERSASTGRAASMIFSTGAP
jgi:hypothetical protein